MAGEDCGFPRRQITPSLVDYDCRRGNRRVPGSRVGGRDMNRLKFLLVVMLPAGCTRMHYRRRADNQAYQILAEKSNDPRWTLSRVDITPDPRSRFSDPYHPDCPPLPPDDPAAHRFMHCASGKLGWKHWHDFGRTEHVENPQWPTFLGGDEFAAAGGSLPVVKDVTLADELTLYADDHFEGSPTGKAVLIDYLDFQ